ncbi:MAG: ribbon-helix-helix domain-containing protein [Phycisphaerae bacterium]|nr:ribbon-helix-helix domain-containing protein [Phycisphaerae bacterium]
MAKNNRNANDKVTLKIPRPLYNKISEVIEGAGYNSVTDFVVYVLRDLVVSHEMAGPKNEAPDNTEVVKERLKALGYL